MYKERIIKEKTSPIWTIQTCNVSFIKCFFPGQWSYSSYVFNWFCWNL